MTTQRADNAGRRLERLGTSLGVISAGLCALWVAMPAIRTVPDTGLAAGLNYFLWYSAVPLLFGCGLLLFGFMGLGRLAAKLSRRKR